MAGYGKKLIDLHLLKAPELDPPIARFQGKGNDRVEKVRYDSQAERVYINTVQFFEGIPDIVWNYQIGGYKVCDKWLKDRKGRALSLEETKYYLRIVTTIKKTAELQTKIDDLFRLLF